MKVRMPALLAAVAASVLVVGGAIVLAAPSSADDAVLSSPDSDAAAFTRVDLQLGGETLATFHTMTLTSSTDRPFGPADYPQSIVLTRAYGDTDAIHAWHHAVGGGDLTQVQNFLLVLVDESEETVGRYFVTEGFPKVITALNKRQSVERVEFLAEVIERQGT